MVLGGSLAPDDLVRVDAKDGRLTFEVVTGGAERAEEVTNRSRPRTSGARRRRSPASTRSRRGRRRLTFGSGSG